MTSSVAAIMNNKEENRTLTEKDWNNVETTVCYMKSKLLSEITA